MPTITATCGTTSAEGFNLIEREVGDVDAKTTIKNHAKPLADYLDTCTKKLGRDFYSCAEAHALAKLLDKLTSTIDFRKIVLSRPTSDSGQLLWSPCENCEQWLVECGGWGPHKIYRIKNEVLDLLSPKQQPSKTLLIQNYNTEFPKL